MPWQTRNNYYYLGYIRGNRIASSNETAEDAFEAEELNRQYSPFEFLAHEINSQENAGKLWEEFDAGIADGINAYFE